MTGEIAPRELGEARPLGRPRAWRRASPGRARRRAGGRSSARARRRRAARRRTCTPMKVWPSLGIAAPRRRSRSAGPRHRTVGRELALDQRHRPLGPLGRDTVWASRVWLAVRELRRGQSVQPGVVLARDEVQRAAVQPRDHKRAIVAQGAVDVGGVQPAGARPDREPSAPRVLALDGEQALHGRDWIARGAPGEQLRGQPPRERAHAATGALVARRWRAPALMPPRGWPRAGRRRRRCRGRA